jgi:hypothetical protein
MRRRVGLIVVMVLAAACQHADRSVGRAEVLHQIRINGVPVVRELTSPPGAPLRNGFVVPEGTVLLGDVVPQSYAARPGPGWWAVLAVTGSFPRVAAQLGLQMRRAGMVVEVACTRPVFCDVRGVGGDGAMEVELGRNRIVSSAMVRFSEFRSTTSADISTTTIAPGTVADPPVADMAELPSIGDELLPSYQPLDRSPKRLRTLLEPGTVAVGPPVVSGNLETMVVLSTKQPAGPIVRAYFRRFQMGFERPIPASPVETRRAGGTSVRHYSVYEPDFVGLDLYVVDPRTGPTTIFLNRFED